MRKIYSIWSPPYSITSGGIKVLYGLYGHLLARGEQVYLNGQFQDPKDTIAIYPEIAHGNQLNAEKVVRYILQVPGLMGTTLQTGSFQQGPSTDEIKATSDYITIFSKVYDTIGVPDEQIMFLPIINLKVFYDQKKLRNKTCFLIGKGINQSKHPKDSIELTRQFAVDQQALAELLNECHTFYCYDRLSAMGEVARLAGCKVQYYGDFSREELAKYEPGMNGMGYRNEEVKLDVSAFREHYIGLIRTFEQRLDRFIEITQHD